jgi:hypothetical protein
MARETLYLVQAFQSGKGTRLTADPAIRCKSPEGARRTAEGLAETRAGVVAFATSGDGEPPGRAPSPGPNPRKVAPHGAASAPRRARLPRSVMPIWRPLPLISPLFFPAQTLFGEVCGGIFRPRDDRCRD